MKNFSSTQQHIRGYIALMATIIISAILLVMSVEGSLAGWHARFNILGTEAKEQASSLAQGCADQALSAIVTNPSYTGGATTTSSIGTCYVFPIEFNTPVAGVVTIKAQAEVRGSFANLEMQMNMSEIHIDSVPDAPTKGTLVVITNAINDGSGTKHASDFTMSVSGGNPSQTSFAGDESGYVVTVDPGSYTVSGNTPSGYAKTTSTNCSGSITTGAIKFCTVTYDDITTTLTVLVNVINDDGGLLSHEDVVLKIDGTTVTEGQIKTVTPGNHIVSAVDVANYTQSPWGFQCDALGNVTVNEGQNKTCVVNFTDNPPPAPSCAETVMILDRTGSMSSSDLSNEKNAANSLTDLYASVQPPATPPRLGVGSIGGLNGGSASIPLLGQLSAVYTNIKSAITSITGGNSSVGSDLSAGITTASDELNGTRHEAGKEKVLILVSDGDPNEPSGTITTDTGFKSASSSGQESGSSFWSLPTGAYSDGGTDATGQVNGSANRERFFNFNFGNSIGLPVGATVRGIQAQIDAWATAGLVSVAGNSVKNPTTAIAPNSWSNPTRVNGSDNSYATSNISGQQQGYAGFGFTIPANATITGVEVSTEGKLSGGSQSTTATLIPSGQGSDTSWSGDSTDVDESGSIDCGTNDRLETNTNNRRESVNLNLSSIPNGSTITSVQIFTWDQAGSNQSGSYKTYVTVGNSTTDASSNLTTTSQNGCTQRTQTVDIADVIKASNTDFEVGVLKVGNTTVRVGAIRAIVTYTQSTSGSLDVTLSSNNGSTWTTSKQVALTSTESVDSPTGNSSTDLWGRSWSPSDFNNGNFALKVQNNAINGVTVSLDQILVNVHYTTPSPTGTACSLGVDFSWNGGGSWSTEKTQSLNSTESTYTLPSATNDDWSSTHTWVSTDFSNTNFRARVRAIDPGSSCDNSALDHLDWLQVKVYYSVATDPVQAALAAADLAKLSGISLFTIHFGSDPSGYAGKELLANIANGSVAVSGHENGSQYNAGAGTTGDTNYKQPTVAHTPSQFTNPTRGFASDNSYATDAVNGHTQGYSTFGLVIPPLSTIKGILVDVEAKSSDSSGCQIGADISWDDGVTFTSAGQVNSLSGSDATYTFGGSASLWGRTWNLSELADTKFVVRLKNIDPGNACTNGSTLSVDRVRTRVYYATPDPENGDGDNFFVAPTSADMKEIFNAIAGQVCPALGYAAASQPPTQGQVTVITNVINNNGGSTGADEIQITATPSSATPHTFAGDTGGVNVTFNPGSYSISGDVPDGYAEIQGAGCTSGSTGDITAGEFRVCVLTYDDIPPPPPPPNLSIHLDQWKELPVAN